MASRRFSHGVDESIPSFVETACRTIIFVYRLFLRFFVYHHSRGSGFGAQVLLNGGGGEPPRIRCAGPEPTLLGLRFFWGGAFVVPLGGFWVPRCLLLRWFRSLLVDVRVVFCCFLGGSRGYGGAPVLPLFGFLAFLGRPPGLGRTPK